MSDALPGIPERVPRGPSMADAHEAMLLTRRRFLRNAALAAGAVAAGPTLWRRPGWAAVPPEGAHLTYGADPASQMALSWMTASPVDGAVLRVGLDESYGLTIPAETRTVMGHPTLYHHARVDGLAPGTTYHYRLEHDGGMTSGTFRTAPVTPEPFTFTAFGDQGVGATGASTTARVAAIAPAFHFLVGDLCYAYRTGTGDVTRPAPLQPVLQPMLTNQATWDGWLRQVDEAAAVAPWMTTVGNHEMEYGYGELGYDAYLARFLLPNNGAPGAPTTYSFRYGNVAVIALDGNDASYEISANRGYTGEAQDAWLAQTLADLRTDPAVDFIVAGFHNCSYCSNIVHASDGGTRARWGSLLETQADVVVNGHNHQYERAHPIRHGVVTREVASGGTIEPAQDGVTYVTAGGGGQVSYQATLYPASYVVNEFGVRVPETSEWSARRYLDLSLVAFDVTPRDGAGRATMTMRALRPDGSEIERVTFERSTP